MIFELIGMLKFFGIIIPVSLTGQEKWSGVQQRVN